MSTADSTPTRSQAGRTLDTCVRSALYIIDRAIDINYHYNHDDVAFTEWFNLYQNATAEGKGPRDTTRDWTAEEVIVLLIEALQREKVDLAAVREKRGARTVRRWRAVDSAASIALGLDILQGREDRRALMRHYAAVAEQERREDAVRQEESRARRPMPYRRPPPSVFILPRGTRAKNRRKNEGKGGWKMEVTLRPAGVVKSKEKPGAKTVVLVGNEKAKEGGWSFRSLVGRSRDFGWLRDTGFDSGLRVGLFTCTVYVWVMSYVSYDSLDMAL